MARVLVEPQSAKYEVPPTFTHQIGPNAGGKRLVEPSLGVEGPSDDDLCTYLTGAYAHSHAATAAAKVPGAAANPLNVAHKLQVAGMVIGSGGVSANIGRGRYRFTEPACSLTANASCWGRALRIPVLRTTTIAT